MIRPYSLSRLIAETELIPQAMLSGSLSDLAARHGWTLEKGHDDLDAFQGSAFLLPSAGRAKAADDMPFAVMHYKGHPPSTSTIYLPFEIQNVSAITALIARITAGFDLKTRLLWQRRDSHPA